MCEIPQVTRNKQGAVISFVCDIGDAVDFDCSGELLAEERHDVMRHVVVDMLGS